MALYEYRCTHGHVTRRVQPMSHETPAAVTCETFLPALPLAGIAFRAPEDEITTQPCGELAHRVFSPPAAIHFRGPGFYSTDVKSRSERRRRPNPGDDLHREHDPTAAAIVK